MHLKWEEGAEHAFRVREEGSTYVPLSFNHCQHVMGNDVRYSQKSVGVVEGARITDLSLS